MIVSGTGVAVDGGDIGAIVVGIHTQFQPMNLISI